MSQSPGLLLTILAFALVIGPLIFLHEMGHYLAGRWFGVKIDAFSIGFGKEVFGWTDRQRYPLEIQRPCRSAAM